MMKRGCGLPLICEDSGKKYCFKIYFESLLWLGCAGFSPAKNGVKISQKRTKSPV